MDIKYERYSFTPVLGWSSSRYEVFDKCKRQYYYTYYSNYITDVPAYKLKMFKALTSVALEVGNVIHDVMEALLKRLQISDSDIKEEKFVEFAQNRAREYFSQKTFLDLYYHQVETINIQDVLEKVDGCLHNFITSPVYSWLFMKAIYNRDNWMIEPEGYGETRLKGLKAYCKMDFLFPVDDAIYIFDWKTGKKDAYKHSNQLVAYAAAASNNFHIPWKKIIPKIVYLHPQFDELEITLSDETLNGFFDKVQQQTLQMYGFCADKEKNIPLPVESFPKTPSPGICRYCNFQELCFPEGIACRPAGNQTEVFGG